MKNSQGFLTQKMTSCLLVVGALTATAFVAPATAQSYSGGPSTQFNGVGDQIGSVYDQVIFAPISGNITGPGTYNFDTVTFLTGTNSTTTHSFSGTFLLTETIGGDTYSLPLSYNGTIVRTDTITIGGNTVKFGNLSVFFNPLTLTTSTSATGTLTGTVLSIPAAVPEPATWAMMVLAFGAVGFAMRRHRKVATQAAYAA